MKRRWIAAVLLLSTLFCTLSCAGAAVPAQDGAEVQQNENFIPVGQNALLSTEENAAQEGNLINLAAKDEEDAPLYHIVYNISSSLRVVEQCEALAANIADATGVKLPVIHSSQPTKNQYELMVGRVTREETLEITDELNATLGENDFCITVAGTRVLIFATTDQSLMSAVIFFMEQLATKDTASGVYGLEADTDYTYTHAKNPPLELLGLTEDGYAFDFRLTTGLNMYTYVRLSFTGNAGWRLQTKYRETDSFMDDGAAQLLAYSLGEYELGTEDDRFYREKLTVKDSKDICKVTAPDGSRVEFYKKRFTMTFFTPSGAVAHTITGITHNAGGSSITGKFLDKKVGDKTIREAVYGTGERFDNANQRGKKIEMFTKDIWSKRNACYMVIPLLCFSRGSGVFLNKYEHMVLNLGAPGTPDEWVASMTGTGLDCYLYTTEEIEDVIKGYSELSGYAGMPEEWTYGMIVCAYSPDLTQKWSVDIAPNKDDSRGEGVYEMIANMEANDLPWTGVLAEGWGYYRANKHQDLKELCDYVHSLGKKFLVYMSIGYASTDMSGYSAEYLLTQTDADGSRISRLPATTADTNNPDFGTGSSGRIYLDITNPSAVEWFFDDYWSYISNEIGVDGCKIDFCELLPENYTLNYFDKNVPTAGSHHWYPSAFCAMFWDMISQKPDSGMCYTRGGGIGAQRAPYMWAGDQKRYWEGIDMQLTSVLSSGLSGVPYMSYDMAGYQYGPVEDGFRDLDYESEVFLRGTQYSAFTVCIQTHGKVLRSYQFMGLELPALDAKGNKIPLTDEDGNVVKDEGGNVVYKTFPRVPEDEYEYVTQIYRAYTKLHEHLTPYITELSEEASATGLPVVRHLILGWQDDYGVYDIDDQYMFGDAFMVAPIFSSIGDGETASRKIYLPVLEGGAKWIDLNTGVEYEGGQRITVSANLAQLPTFYNPTTESEIAPTLVEGIKEIYTYAQGFLPEN